MNRADSRPNESTTSAKREQVGPAFQHTGIHIGGFVMNLRSLRTKRLQVLLRYLVALLGVGIILPGNVLPVTRPAQQTDQQAVKIPADQLESLVAPIALY